MHALTHRHRFNLHPSTILTYVTVALAVLTVLFVAYGANRLESSVGGDYLQALSNTGTFILQYLPTLVLVGSLTIAVLTYRSDLTVKRVDRFGKAVEQVGNQESASVRCGGIYSMERIAYEDPKYWSSLEAVLCAFLHERQPSKEKPVSPDVQAALNVLTRRAGRDVKDRWPAIDLSGINLQQAEFINGNLGRMIFDGANLQGADLTDSVLRRTSFRGANLQCATFSGSKAIQTDFVGAVLYRSRFLNADVKGADFNGAKLAGSTLLKAKNLDQTKQLKNVASHPNESPPVQIICTGRDSAETNPNG